MIVVDGEIDVECGENLAKAHLTGPGEFWVARAGSPGLGRQGWVARAGSPSFRKWPATIVTVSDETRQPVGFTVS
jgi:hypothetical protein